MESYDPPVEETLMELVMADNLLEALRRVLDLPADDPVRLKIEALAKHTQSFEDYKKHYRETMWGGIYPERNLFSSPEGVPRYKALANRIILDGAQSILELGCLDGWGLLYLCGNGNRGVGVDLNAQALTVGRERALKYNLNVEFIESAIEEFSILERFDAVILSEVLEHVLNPGLCLQTARRHLNPMGKLYISVPSTPIPHHGNLEDALLHLRVFSREDLVTLALEEGFPFLDYEEEQHLVDQGHPYANRLMVFSREL